MRSTISLWRNKTQGQQVLVTSHYFFQQTADGVNLQFTNAIFTTADYPLNQTFQQLTQTYYGVDAVPVNFTDVVRAVAFIQNYVQTATKGRVTNFIHTGNNGKSIHSHVKPPRLFVFQMM